MNPPTSDESSFVARAGGSKESSHRHRHAHSPHIYLVWWPSPGILKIGISTRARWSKWRNTGAAEIGVITTCCIPHAHRIEQYLLGILDQQAIRAFERASAAAHFLGRQAAGWSECYLLGSSDLLGEPLDGPYDYERGYGLAIPPDLAAALSSYDVAWQEVHLSRMAGR